MIRSSPKGALQPLTLPPRGPWILGQGVLWCPCGGHVCAPSGCPLVWWSSLFPQRPPLTSHLPAPEPCPSAHCPPPPLDVGRRATGAWASPSRCRDRTIYREPPEQLDEIPRGREEDRGSDRSQSPDYAG